VEVDAGRTPDLVPTIAVLGAVASGKTTIMNAEHVRHKETDRLHAMAVELAKMGADIRERPDGLEIIGGKLHGASLHGYHDHRIVMALTVAGLVAGDTRIDIVTIHYPVAAPSTDYHHWLIDVNAYPGYIACLIALKAGYKFLISSE
jgi:3-phosphoshikimate 1-carboxyvinyltransferase